MALRGARDESLDEYVDARVAAIRLGEFVNGILSALSSKKG